MATGPAMLEDVLAIPDHLRDALWRVESARVAPSESAGLFVCGMGGSAIGGDLAAATLGERLRQPLMTIRDYELPSWASAGVDGSLLELLGRDRGDPLLLRGRRRSRRPPDRRQHRRRHWSIRRARAGVPVIGLPGLLPAPRVAVAYMLVCAAEAAALAGIAPRMAEEIEAAAAFLEQPPGTSARGRVRSRRRSRGPADRLRGGPDSPVAQRWKTQINENAKLPSFFGELPEADHNDICGWDGVPAIGARVAAVMLEDAGQNPGSGAGSR